jgi:hypothetical protein
MTGANSRWRIAAVGIGNRFLDRKSKSYSRILLIILLDSYRGLETPTARPVLADVRAGCQGASRKRNVLVV